MNADLMSHLVIGLCARLRSACFAMLYRVVPKLSGERTRDKRTSLLCQVVPRISTELSEGICQDIQVLTFFVVTAKNFLESRHFISTKGDFIMSRVVHGSWPKPLAQRQTPLALHVRSIETICRLRTTYWNQAYANMKVSNVT